MRQIKKTLSMLLAIVMLVGMVALPASADDVVIAITKSATKLSNGRWNVSINFAGNPTTLADSIQAYNMAVQYDKSVVTYANKLNNDTSPTTNDGKGPDGNVVLSGWSGTDGIQDSETGDIKESGTLFRLQFTPVNADATEADILAAVNVIEGVDDGGTYKATAFSNGAGVNIPMSGIPVSVGSVELVDDVTEDNVPDDGIDYNAKVDGTNLTVKAAALTGAGNDITGSVTFTVTKDGSTASDITVDGATLTIDGDAEAGLYTVTATGDTSQDVTGSASVTINVEREAERAVSLTIQKGGADAKANEKLAIPVNTGDSQDTTFTAKVINQYGKEITDPEVDWTLTPADTYVTMAGGVVTVSNGATKNNEYTLTATDHTVATATASITITVVDIDITWPTPTVKADPTYGDTWAEIITFTGGSAKLGDDPVSGTFTVVGDDEAEAPNAGSKTYHFNFKSADYDVDSNPSAALTIAPLAIAVPDEDETEYTYTGTEQTYGVAATNDYTVTNNKATDAGTIQVAISLTDKNNTVWADTEDTVDKLYDFTINPATVTITWTDTDLTFDGTEQAPTAATNVTGVTATVSGGQTNAGTYEATAAIEANPNYALDASTAKVSFTIAPLDITSATVSLPDPYDGTYTGAEQKPEVTVKVGELVVVADGIDVAYANNQDVGTATVTVTAKENGNYTGSASTTFEITAKAVDLDVTLSENSFIYNGEVQKPTVDKVSYDDNGTEVVLTAEDYTVVYSDAYSVEVSDGYKVTVSVTGNIEGEKEVSYEIAGIPLDETNTEISNPKYNYVQADAEADPPVEESFTMTSVAVVYNNGAKKVKLTLGRDFELGTPEKVDVAGETKGQVTITFKGNYSGSIDYVFDLYTLGDVTNDKAIDARDSLAVLQIFVGIAPYETPTSVNLLSGDVNLDTNVDAKDSLAILQYFVGLIQSFDQVQKK